jgi:hypothetical protein
MKYLRLFESTKKSSYYHVPYSSDDLNLILACLKKITDDNKKLKRLISTISQYKFNDLYLILTNGEESTSSLKVKDNDVYIGVWIRRDNSDVEEFMKYANSQKLENNGEITLEDHEISAIKYNL